MCVLLRACITDSVWFDALPSTLLLSHGPDESMFGDANENDAAAAAAAVANDTVGFDSAECCCFASPFCFRGTNSLAVAARAELFVTANVCCGMNSVAVAVKFEFWIQLDDDDDDDWGVGGENTEFEFADCG